MIVITLPLPLPEVSPNARPHWAGKGRAVRLMRQAAHVLGLEAKPKGWTPQPIRISATYFCGKSLDRRVRPRDEDNARACLKPYIDGLIDAGLAPSDNASNVKLGELVLLKRAKDHKGKAEVVLVVEPC
jgi:hypothetical protein